MTWMVVVVVVVEEGDRVKMVVQWEEILVAQVVQLMPFLLKSVAWSLEKVCETAIFKILNDSAIDFFFVLLPIRFDCVRLIVILSVLVVNPLTGE